MQIDREGYEKLRESAEKWVEFEGPTIGYSPHPHREELESLLAQFQIRESDLSPLEALADECGERESSINVNAPSEAEKAVANAYGFCEIKLRTLITKMKGEKRPT